MDMEKLNQKLAEFSAKQAEAESRVDRAIMAGAVWLTEQKHTVLIVAVALVCGAIAFVKFA